MEPSYSENDFELIDKKTENNLKCSKELVKCKNNGKRFWIKHYELIEGARAEEIKNRIENGKKGGRIAKHDNLQNLLGFFFRKKQICFIFPYAELGSLHERIAKKPLKESEALEVFNQILEGLHYFHIQGFLHRDIKPDNVCIFLEGGKIIYKVGDYDLAKFYGVAVSKNVGSIAYSAPELFKENKKYSKKIDYWSLGVLLHEILQGKLPWEKTIEVSDQKMKEQISKFVFVENFGTPLSPDMKQLLRGLLEKNPENRFDYWDIKNLPISKNVLQNFPTIGLEEQMYKKEWYYIEKYKKNWVKNPITQIIHNNLKDEFGVFSFSLTKLEPTEKKKVLESCKKEIDLGNTLTHENAKPLENYYLSPDRQILNLIYPYSIAGLLSEMLQSISKFKEKHACKILLQGIEGMNFLHEKKLKYLGISPRNIGLFIRDDGIRNYFIVGCGVLNELEKLTNKTNDYLFYQAPEIFKKLPANHRADYWSFGIMLYQMITGKLPWTAADIESEEGKKSLANEVKNFDFSKIQNDPDLQNEAKELLKGLLSIDPLGRIDYIDIKKSNFATKYNIKKEKKEEKEMTLVKANLEGWQSFSTNFTTVC